MSAGSFTRNLHVLEKGPKDSIYSPRLARFLQPDNIIPDLANPQAVNRYAYALNTPVVLVDPSGHSTCYAADGYGQSCDSGPLLEGVWSSEEVRTGDSIFRDTHSDPQLVKFERDEDHPQDWTQAEMYAVAEGAKQAANALAALYNSMMASGSHVAEGGVLSAADVYLITFGGTTTAIRSSLVQGYGARITGTNEITYYNVRLNNGNIDYDYTADHINHTIHELGHLFDNRTGNYLRGRMVGDLAIGANEDYWKGFPCAFQCGRYSRDTGSEEIFADMFMIWVTGNNFGNYESGDPPVNYSVIRQRHMQTNMPNYLFRAMMGP